MAKIILVANPGSASRKYSLYDGHKPLLHLHFEHKDGKIICTVKNGRDTQVINTGLNSIENSADQLQFMLRQYGGLPANQEVNVIGLRIVAPSSFFLENHEINEEVLGKLHFYKPRSPIHISIALNELANLRKDFPSSKIIGISDSHFHATKPDRAWNYGLPIDVADKYELKRYGYHGLSVGSVVNTLDKLEKLPPKLIVCHLGSGVSVTAVKNGKSIDNTMGYSPLEGVIMATRSGSLDISASEVIKSELKLTRDGLDEYLNTASGLLGLSNKSSDIRDLLKLEKAGDSLAKLSLDTFVYSLVKGVGQMMAALGGADMLVFTGTVGERSTIIRSRTVKYLDFADFILDAKTNKECVDPEAATVVSRLAQSKPIFVVPSSESDEIVKHVLAA